MIGDAGLVYLFVTDMDRAIAFYEETLGLELAYRAGDDWAQFEAGSIQLGLHGAGSGPSRPGGTVAFTVTDLDAAKAGLASKGVTVANEGGGDNAAPRFVEFADPDGNLLALFEYPERA